MRPSSNEGERRMNGRVAPTPASARRCWCGLGQAAARRAGTGRPEPARSPRSVPQRRRGSPCCVRHRALRRRSAAAKCAGRGRRCLRELSLAQELVPGQWSWWISPMYLPAPAALPAAQVHALLDSGEAVPLLPGHRPVPVRSRPAPPSPRGHATTGRRRRGDLSGSMRRAGGDTGGPPAVCHAPRARQGPARVVCR